MTNISNVKENKSFSGEVNSLSYVSIYYKLEGAIETLLNPETKINQKLLDDMCNKVLYGLDFFKSVFVSDSDKSWINTLKDKSIRDLKVTETGNTFFTQILYDASVYLNLHPLKTFELFESMMIIERHYKQIVDIRSYFENYQSNTQNSPDLVEKHVNYINLRERFIHHIFEIYRKERLSILNSINIILTILFDIVFTKNKYLDYNQINSFSNKVNSNEAYENIYLKFYLGIKTSGIGNLINFYNKFDPLALIKMINNKDLFDKQDLMMRDLVTKYNLEEVFVIIQIVSTYYTILDPIKYTIDKEKIKNTNFYVNHLKVIDRLNIMNEIIKFFDNDSTNLGLNNIHSNVIYQENKVLRNNIHCLCTFSFLSILGIESFISPDPIKMMNIKRNFFIRSEIKQIMNFIYELYNKNRLLASSLLGLFTRHVEEIENEFKISSSSNSIELIGNTLKIDEAIKHFVSNFDLTTSLKEMFKFTHSSSLNVITSGLKPFKSLFKSLKKLSTYIFLSYTKMFYNTENQYKQQLSFHMRKAILEFDEFNVVLNDSSVISSLIGELSYNFLIDPFQSLQFFNYMKENYKLEIFANLNNPSKMLIIVEPNEGSIRDTRFILDKKQKELGLFNIELPFKSDGEIKNKNSDISDQERLVEFNFSSFNNLDKQFIFKNFLSFWASYMDMQDLNEEQIYLNSEFLRLGISLLTNTNNCYEFINNQINNKVKYDNCNLSINTNDLEKEVFKKSRDFIIETMFSLISNDISSSIDKIESYCYDLKNTKYTSSKMSIISNSNMNHNNNEINQLNQRKILKNISDLRMHIIQVMKLFNILMDFGKEKVLDLILKDIHNNLGNNYHENTFKLNNSEKINNTRNILVKIARCYVIEMKLQKIKELNILNYDIFKGDSTQLVLDLEYNFDPDTSCASREFLISEIFEFLESIYNYKSICINVLSGSRASELSGDKFNENPNLNRYRNTISFLQDVFISIYSDFTNSNFLSMYKSLCYTTPEIEGKDNKYFNLIFFKSNAARILNSLLNVSLQLLSFFNTPSTIKKMNLIEINSDFTIYFFTLNCLNSFNLVEIVTSLMKIKHTTDCNINYTFNLMKENNLNINLIKEKSVDLQLKNILLIKNSLFSEVELLISIVLLNSVNLLSSLFQIKISALEHEIFEYKSKILLTSNTSNNNPNLGNSIKIEGKNIRATNNFYGNNYEFVDEYIGILSELNPLKDINLLLDNLLYGVVCREVELSYLNDDTLKKETVSFNIFLSLMSLTNSPFKTIDTNFPLIDGFEYNNLLASLSKSTYPEGLTSIYFGTLIDEYKKNKFNLFQNTNFFDYFTLQSKKCNFSLLDCEALHCLCMLLNLISLNGISQVQKNLFYQQEEHKGIKKLEKQEGKKTNLLLSNMLYKINEDFKYSNINCSFSIFKIIDNLLINALEVLNEIDTFNKSEDFLNPAFLSHYISVKELVKFMKHFSINQPELFNDIIGNFNSNINKKDNFNNFKITRENNMKEKMLSTSIYQIIKKSINSYEASIKLGKNSQSKTLFIMEFVLIFVDLITTFLYSSNIGIINFGRNIFLADHNDEICLRILTILIQDFAIGGINSIGFFKEIDMSKALSGKFFTEFCNTKHYLHNITILSNLVLRLQYDYELIANDSISTQKFTTSKNKITIDKNQEKPSTITIYHLIFNFLKFIYSNFFNSFLRNVLNEITNIDYNCEISNFSDILSKNNIVFMNKKPVFQLDFEEIFKQIYNLNNESVIYGGDLSIKHNEKIIEHLKRVFLSLDKPLDFNLSNYICYNEITLKLLPFSHLKNDSINSNYDKEIKFSNIDHHLKSKSINSDNSDYKNKHKKIKLESISERQEDNNSSLDIGQLNNGNVQILINIYETIFKINAYTNLCGSMNSFLDNFQILSYNCISSGKSLISNSEVYFQLPRSEKLESIISKQNISFNISGNFNLNSKLDPLEKFNYLMLENVINQDNTLDKLSFSLIDIIFFKISQNDVKAIEINSEKTNSVEYIVEWINNIISLLFDNYNDNIVKKEDEFYQTHSKYSKFDDLSNNNNSSSENKYIDSVTIETNINYILQHLLGFLINLSQEFKDLLNINLKIDKSSFIGNILEYLNNKFALIVKITMSNKLNIKKGNSCNIINSNNEITVKNYIVSLLSLFWHVVDLNTKRIYEIRNDVEQSNGFLISKEKDEYMGKINEICKNIKYIFEYYTDCQRIITGIYNSIIKSLCLFDYGQYDTFLDLKQTNNHISKLNGRILTNLGSNKVGIENYIISLESIILQLNNFPIEITSFIVKETNLFSFILKTYSPHNFAIKSSNKSEFFREYVEIYNDSETFIKSDEFLNWIATLKFMNSMAESLNPHFIHKKYSDLEINKFSENSFNSMNQATYNFILEFFNLNYDRINSVLSLIEDLENGSGSFIKHLAFIEEISSIIHLVASIISNKEFRKFTFVKNENLLYNLVSLIYKLEFTKLNKNHIKPMTTLEIFHNNVSS